MPDLPPQPTQLLSTLTAFFTSIPNLETQYEQIYSEVRGNYITSSLESVAAAVLSSAQGRPGSPVTPATFIRATISLLETELDILSTLIPSQPGESPVSEIFTVTATGPLQLFSRTFKALNTQIRTSPSQNFTLVLSILDDLTFAQELLTRTSIPSTTIEGIRKDIAALEREAKGIGGVGVGDIIEDVKRRGNNVLTLPSDGGVIEFTTEVSIPNYTWVY
jgi:exocyst complex protein 7